MIQSLIARTFYFFRGDTVFWRLILNSGWLLSANTIAMALTVIQGIIVARMLGVEQYGVLTLITTYTATVSRFVDSRVWETAIKFVTQYREEGDSDRAGATIKLCYLVDAVTGALAFTLLLLTADLAARLFVKDVAAADLIRVYAFSMLIGIPIGTSSALLRIDNRFGWLAYQQVGVAALRLASALVVLMLGMGVKELLVVYLLVTGIGMVGLVMMSKIAVQSLGLVTWWKASLSSLRNRYGRMARFLVSTNGSAFLKLLQGNADILLIGYWFTPTQVGYFRLARSLAGLISFSTKPFYTTAYPEFARLWHQGKLVELRRLIRKLAISQASVVFVALVFMLLGGSLLVRLTVGEEYLPSLPVLYWLALGVAIGGATNFGHPLLLAISQPSKSLMAMALGVVAQLTVLVLLLPTMGITAAGMAYFGFYLIWATIVIVSVRVIWQN